MKNKVNVSIDTTIIEINCPEDYTPGQFSNAIKKQLLKRIKEGTININININEE